MRSRTHPLRRLGTQGSLRGFLDTCRSPPFTSGFSPSTLHHQPCAPAPVSGSIRTFSYGPISMAWTPRKSRENTKREGRLLSVPWPWSAPPCRAAGYYCTISATGNTPAAFSPGSKRPTARTSTAFFFLPACPAPMTAVNACPGACRRDRGSSAQLLAVLNQVVHHAGIGKGRGIAQVLVFVGGDLA